MSIEATLFTGLAVLLIIAVAGLNFKKQAKNCAL
jgi:hypothetical protein